MNKEELEDLLHVLGLDYEAEPTLIYLFYTKPDGTVNNFSISVRQGGHMSDKELEQLMRKEYPATRNGELLRVERPNAPLCPWLDTTEVCNLLHINPRTLRRWTARGLFHPSTMGGRQYYNINEINAVMDANVVTENGHIDLHLPSTALTDIEGQ